jgi:hypothetical protein
MNKIKALIFLAVLFSGSCSKESGESYILRQYGDVFEDIGYSLAIAHDGYIIAGQSENIDRADGMIVTGSADKNMIVIKTDWEGDVKWKTVIGGKDEDLGSRIYQLSDGSMLCVGTYTDTTGGTSYQKEVFLVKLSSSGEISWQKTYGEKGNQTGRDIIETDFGYLIVGTTDIENVPVTASSGNPEGKTDILIIRVDNNGQLIDTLRRGFPGNEIASGIKRDGSGNYIILGTTEMPSNPLNKHDLFLIKLNPEGSVIQSKVIGNEDDEYSSDIEVLDNGYMISATIGAQGVDQQGYVLKLNTDIHSSPVFQNKFRVDDMSTSIRAICRYGSSNFAVAGSVGSGLNSKMLVIEMDESGNLAEGSKMIRGSSGEQVVNDVVSGDDSYVVAVGKNKYDLNSMITFLKFKF